jgi:hypothetical protein
VSKTKTHRQRLFYTYGTICARKPLYHQLPLWDTRPRYHAGGRTVDGWSVESAKANLLLYCLLIYTGRIQGYIRTPIRVPSWFFIFTHTLLLVVTFWITETLCLIITWQHSQIDQDLSIDLFGAPPGIFPRYLKRTYPVESPDRKQYGWETDRWRWKPEKA